MVTIFIYSQAKWMKIVTSYTINILLYQDSSKDGRRDSFSNFELPTLIWSSEIVV